MMPAELSPVRKRRVVSYLTLPSMTAILLTGQEENRALKRFCHSSSAITRKDICLAESFRPSSVRVVSFARSLQTLNNLFLYSVSSLFFK